ncbi:hypothetical protein JCM6882_008601 [Rhodosporidiobolus microsporus]
MDASNGGRPRQTINDLPTELKSRIAELCAEQDADVVSTMKAVEDEDGVPYEFAEMAEAVRKTSNYGSSLGGLSSTSKDWSDICAPFRFKTLRASRATADFKWSIAYPRSAFFTTLDLDTVVRENLLEALALSPAFPKLESVVLWPTLSVHLQSAEGKVALPSLQRLLKRVSHLTLKDMSLATIWGLDLVPHSRFGNLRRLDVAGLGYWDGSDLLELLNCLPNLERLNITVDEGEPASLVLPAGLGPPVRRIYASLPALRHLSLRAATMQSDFIPFANVFATSLETLALGATAVHDDWTDHPDFEEVTLGEGVSFPSLRSLCIEGPPNYSHTFIRSLYAKAFPSLRHLTLRADVVEAPTTFRTVEALNAALTCTTRLSFPHPLHITILGPKRTAVQLASHVFTAVAPPGRRPLRIVPPVPAPSEPFKLAPHELRAETQDRRPAKASRVSEQCVEGLEGVVDFLRRRIDWAKRTNDGVALARLVEAARALELERVAVEL